MSELPQVVPGEPVDAATFGNPVIDRVISRYADESIRDAQVPIPQAGDPAYIVDINDLQIYSGTAWVSISLYLPEFGAQNVSTVFNTTSLTYVDLGGPAATIDVKSSAVATFLHSHASNNTPGGAARASVQAEGANSIGPSDNAALQFSNSGTGTTSSLDATVSRPFTGLVPGPTTFRAMYRAHNLGQATFARATLTVIQI